MTFYLLLLCSVFFTGVFANFGDFLSPFGSRGSINRYKSATKKEHKFFDILNPNYPIEHRSCSMIGRTYESPFVVFILAKTSGRFMGMGCIIDRKTVLTAEDAIQGPITHVNHIVVLAGCRSPWWGKNSQVRRARSVAFNGFDLGLVVVDAFEVNANVAPINIMNPTVRDIPKVYGNVLGTFGILINDYNTIGGSIKKGTVYYFSLETLSKGNECEKDYQEIRSGFNSSFHHCLINNGSYCNGCLGAPVVALRGDSLELIAVVIKSKCGIPSKQSLIINIGWFESWIRANSFMGYAKRKHRDPSFH